MLIKIDIETSNDTFGHGAKEEIQRILRDQAKKLKDRDIDRPCSFTVRDINGHNIGSFVVKA